LNLLQLELHAHRREIGAHETHSEEQSGIGHAVGLGDIRIATGAPCEIVPRDPRSARGYIIVGAFATTKLPSSCGASARGWAQ